MYSFDYLITPKIIAFLYWISNIGCAIYLFAPFDDGPRFSIEKLIYLVVSWIVIRVSFELVMVSFKNNEYLRRIAEKDSN